MAAPCSVCNDSRRSQIETALLAGEPLREIAKKFAGVSRSSLARHRERHTEIPPGERVNQAPVGAVKKAREDLRALDAMKTTKEAERDELRAKRAGVESELRALEDRRAALVIAGHRQGSPDALAKLDSLSERSFKLERQAGDLCLLDAQIEKELLALKEQRCAAEAVLTKIELAALYEKSEPIAARLTSHLASIESDWRELDQVLNGVMTIELERISHEGVHPGQTSHFVALRLFLDSLRRVFARLGLHADINGSSVPRVPTDQSFAQQWTEALAQRIQLIRPRRDVVSLNGDNGEPTENAESLAAPTPAPAVAVAPKVERESEPEPEVGSIDSDGVEYLGRAEDVYGK